MNKNMIQRLIHRIMAMAAIAVLLVSCRQDEWFEPSPVAREGYVHCGSVRIFPLWRK